MPGVHNGFGSAVTPQPQESTEYFSAFDVFVYVKKTIFNNRRRVSVRSAVQNTKTAITATFSRRKIEKKCG